MTNQTSLEKATQEILNTSEWFIRLDAADILSITGRDTSNVQVKEVSTTDSSDNRFKDLIASMQTLLEPYYSSKKARRILYFFQYPSSIPMTKTELDTINQLIEDSVALVSDYEIIWGAASREDDYSKIICIFSF